MLNTIKNKDSLYFIYLCYAIYLSFVIIFIGVKKGRKSDFV